MKLSKLINELQQTYNEFGDLDVIYSEDEEGNRYNRIFFTPTIGIYEDHEFMSVSPENENLKEEINSICIN